MTDCITTEVFVVWRGRRRRRTGGGGSGGSGEVRIALEICSMAGETGIWGRVKVDNRSSKVAILTICLFHI